MSLLFHGVQDLSAVRELRRDALACSVTIKNAVHRKRLKAVVHDAALIEAKLITALTQRQRALIGLSELN